MAMNDTTMTIVGNVVDDPRRRRTTNGHEVASFRVASTGRRFDRELGTFVDTPTLFVNVTAWRQLAVNVGQSVHKGQAVIVTGRFTMREWKEDEQMRSAYELEANAVGHDLTRGIAKFTRVKPTAGRVTVEHDESGAPKDESHNWLDLADSADSACAGDPSGFPADVDDVDDAQRERELVGVAG